MMLRLAVCCSGCDKPVIVRMGIDSTEGVSFYFPCPHSDCGLPIRGTARSGEGSAFKVTFVESRELELQSVPTDAPVTTVNPFVPGHFGAASLDALGGSSIFVLERLLGPRLLEFGAQRSQAAEAIGELWPPARRLYEYYLAENWDRFDRTVNSDFEDWNLPREGTTHARAVTAHQPMLAATWHVVEPGDATLKLLESFHGAHVAAAALPEYRELLKVDGDAGKVQELQRSVFDAIERFVVRYEMWAMGGLPRLMSDSLGADLDQLTLARDEFSETGPLYQLAFETISKTLRYPVAAQNTLLRGDPNDFGDDHPREVETEDRPKNLRQFERIPNAYKLAYVRQADGWDALSTIMDNKVRNSIGHASARHDLRTGRVVSEKDVSGINYIVFLAGVYELFDLLSVTLQMLRSVRVSSSRDWPPEAA